MVIYGSVEDEEASRIIADAFGYVMTPIPPDIADPLTQHTDEDIIVVGGYYPNVFYRHYFCGGVIQPVGFWDSLLNPESFPNNPEIWKISQGYTFGISPDGKRHVQTIVRENGTKVTAIAGVHKADTLESAEQYALPVLPVLGVVLPLAGIAPALTVWTSWGVKASLGVKWLLKR